MQIISISGDTGERYTEMISGLEQPAPLLAVYDIEVSTDDETHKVKAEVRRSPNGEQIDWEDELYFTESKGAETLCEVIYKHFLDSTPEFPILLIGGHIDLLSR